MPERRYCVTTYDIETEAYTPHEGLSVPSQNVTLAGLLRALRALREWGYECTRHDSSVLVERVDFAGAESEVRA